MNRQSLALLVGFGAGLAVAATTPTTINVPTPVPQPMPDATPVVRGAINTDPTQQVRGKTFSDKLTIAADSGVALRSVCVPTQGDLGACPGGNGLQCVLDAGWWACLPDAGWSALATGSSTVSSVAATSPLAVSGSANVTVSCATASSGQAGCLSSSDWSAFNAKESGLTFNAPLSRTANAVSCTPAADGVAGCVSTGVQVWNGRKVSTDGFISWANNADSSPLAWGIYAQFGIALDGPLFPLTNERNVTVEGKRIDQTPGVLLTNYYWVDGGIIAGVQYPGCTGAYALSAGEDGLYYGEGFDRNCASSSDELVGGLVFNSTLSGAIALRGAPGFHLNIAGQIGDTRYVCAKNTDGGEPPYDGGPNTTLLSDGGICWSYAGKHGNLAADALHPMYAGFLMELFNPIGADGNRWHRAFWDQNGVYSQNHGITYANFPPPVQLQMTTIGQYYYGALESAQMFGFGNLGTPGEQRMHVMTQQMDGGEGWTQLAFQAPVYGPPIFVNAALVASSTLGYYVAPELQTALLDYLHLTIGTAGSGGSSNATIRFDDGNGHVCDYAFACNHVAGPLRLVGSGSGCTANPGATYTVTVNTLGACTGGGAPVLTGNITPELRWQ